MKIPLCACIFSFFLGLRSNQHAWAVASDSLNRSCVHWKRFFNLMQSGLKNYWFSWLVSACIFPHGQFSPFEFKLNKFCYFICMLFWIDMENFHLTPLSQSFTNEEKLMLWLHLHNIHFVLGFINHSICFAKSVQQLNSSCFSKDFVCLLLCSGWTCIMLFSFVWYSFISSLHHCFLATLEIFALLLLFSFSHTKKLVMLLLYFKLCKTQTLSFSHIHYIRENVLYNQLVILAK